jgi:hypothetical protein
LGGRHDPGGDVQGHPTNIAVAQLHLAGVQPGADLHRDAAELIPKGNRAVDSPPGAVEGGQEPVAGGLGQAAACLLDQPVGQLDQFRASDVVGQVLAMAGGHEGGVASVQDQRWRLDQGKQGAGVDIGQGSLECRHRPPGARWPADTAPTSGETAHRPRGWAPGSPPLPRCPTVGRTVGSTGRPQGLPRRGPCGCSCRWSSRHRVDRARTPGSRCDRLPGARSWSPAAPTLPDPCQAAHDSRSSGRVCLLGLTSAPTAANH